MRVSIVIPTFGNLDLTVGCLDAIRRTTTEAQREVIVVDNGSTDGTREWLARQPDVLAILNDENRGFAKACNQGADAATGDAILFLNNDTIPHDGWLEALVAPLADPQVGVVGAKLLYADGTIQHAGVVVGERDGDPYPFHVYVCQPADAPHVSHRRELQMVTGACLLARPELARFDEAYVNGHEDLDLCLAAREAGFSVVYEPACVVTHLESRTKRVLGMEQFHYVKGVDNEEGRGRARFLARWRDTLVVDELDVYREDGLVPPEQAPDGLHVVFTMIGWAEEGGGTILPRQIAKALVRRGHRVTVISAAFAQRPDLPPYAVETRVEDGVQLVEVFNRAVVFNAPDRPDLETDDPHARRLVAQILEQLRPDVVHYHSFLGFSMALAGEVDRLGLPSLFTSHNYWPIDPQMYLFHPDLSLCAGPEHCRLCTKDAGRREAGKRMLNEHVDRHLAVSTRVRELYAANGHDPERIVVLQQQPETVDWIHAEAGSRREPVTELDRPLRVGFIGSLYPHKGVHVLVQALQGLAPGEVEAHLFGGGSEQYREGLAALDGKGLVTFHGGYETDELPGLLAGVDVVCVPSVWEDCAPLVVAEALAAGTPVVGARIGGIPDFVRDGVDGFLVEPGSPEAFAGALRRLVDEPGLLGRLQAAIRPPRGFDAYLDELVDHYRSTIAERAARPRPSALEGARGFVALAFADELAAEPELLVAYGERFGAADDATLAIYAPGRSAEELGELLGPALELAGLDGEDSPDLLAVAAGGGAGEEVALAGAVHALFSRHAAAGFAALPRVAEAERLRELAERAWAA